MVCWEVDARLVSTWIVTGRSCDAAITAISIIRMSFETLWVTSKNKSPAAAIAALRTLVTKERLLVDQQSTSIAWIYSVGFSFAT